MKICVTGGAGMIGSALVRRLTSIGHTVTIVDNLWRGRLANIEGISGLDLSRYFHNIDLSDLHYHKKTIDVFKGHDVVIHLADIVAGIGYVFNNQYDIYRINNQINTNTFHACAEAGIPKILYAGTACSFPKTLQMSLDSVLKEEDLYPAYPESAYGWSKLNGTLELEFLSQKFGTEVVTLMLHNVYGPFCDLDPGRSQVIPSIIRKMIELNEGEQLSVWGSGNQGRAFLFVDDVVTGFEKCLEKRSIPQVIQLGPSTCTSIKDLVFLLRDKVLRKKIEIAFDASKPEGDLGRCADYSLASTHLDWQPGVSLEDGLLETYAWINSQLVPG